VTSSTVFTSNRSRAVRLPKAVAFPGDVHRLDILKIGNRLANEVGYPMTMPPVWYALSCASARLRREARKKTRPTIPGKLCLLRRASAQGTIPRHAQATFAKDLAPSGRPAS
jgi:hypothetical protein